MIKPETILKRYIITKYVVKRDVIQYGLEMKQCARLIKLFPDFHFWEHMTIAPLQSLTQLLTIESLEYLQTQYNLFKLKMVESTPVTLSTNKVGDDLKLDKPKPSTLLEFLS